MYADHGDVQATFLAAAYRCFISVFSMKASKFFQGIFSSATYCYTLGCRALPKGRPILSATAVLRPEEAGSSGGTVPKRTNRGRARCSVPDPGERSPGSDAGSVDL